MLITAIEPQKNSPHRFNIYVDEAFAIGISADTLLQFGIRKGDTVDDALLSAIHHAEDVYSAKQKALDYLSRRMHSEYELGEKLRKKKYPEDIINIVLTDFRKAGYLDDNKFVELFTTDILKKRPQGRRLLDKRLRQKGIDQEIIHEVVDKREEKDEESEALNALRKKIRASRSRFIKYEPLVRKKKFAQFLAQRGFDWSIIQKVLKKLDNEITEYNND